tara:strand:- start:163 stop:1053 length:891 start_codon:yes stop_codon:yes gene_type:complete
MNPTYPKNLLNTRNVMDKVWVKTMDNINKKYLNKIDFYSYITKEDKKREYDDSISVRTCNLDRLLYFCHMVATYRDSHFLRSIDGDIDYEWDCILEDQIIFRFETNDDIWEADLVYIKGNLSVIKKMDYLKKYLNKRIRWLLLRSIRRSSFKWDYNPIQYDNIYINIIDTIITHRGWDYTDRCDGNYSDMWEEFSQDPYYHNSFVRDGSRGSLAWITNWLITIIGCHNIKTKNTIRLLEKVSSNYLHSLYNPHTDRGYKFALKNIDWAFEKKRKFNVKKKIVEEEDEIYIGDGVYL